MEFCCEGFRRYFENPPRGAYNRTASIIQENCDDYEEQLYRENKGTRWWADTSDREYSGFPLHYCPFCGAKLVQDMI